jgi:hypothetical protein
MPIPMIHAFRSASVVEVGSVPVPLEDLPVR